jgi:hypothetical protein
MVQAGSGRERRRRGGMRATRSALLAASMALAGAQGCAVFTSYDTDGYTLADASSDGPHGDARICEAGICPTLSLDCRSAADCDGGGVCCLAPTGLISLAFACSTKPCAGPAFQLCTTDAECMGTPCRKLACEIDGLVVQDVSACGVLPGCVAE